MIDAGTIVTIFDALFAETYRTRLRGGAPEPVYLPAARKGHHLIVFKEDFGASALHEVAHWCIAGPRRRQLEDYGYWYESSRDAARQSQFQSVEARPQALEWLFSVASARPFRVSFDNLEGCGGDERAFRCAVKDEAMAFMSAGLPYRAEQFARALAAHPAGCEDFLSPAHYNELPR